MRAYFVYESDTYQMILDEGQEKGTREGILIVGEERFGLCPEVIRTQLSNVADLGRLKRMLHRAAKAESWPEILETP